MLNLQKIKIEGKEYQIIDSIQDFRAEDSFIHRKNKLAQFKGNGESKKHVGTYKGEKGDRMSNFFNYSTWGLEHFDLKKKRKNFESAKEKGALISESKCFFSKSNFLKYLNDAKTEYFAQEQHYHNNISKYYNERLEEVNNLENNEMLFSIYDASDNLSQKQNRGYIRSDDSVWKLWRELILPSISYLSILKLVPIGSIHAEPLFYFRILLDYQFRSFVHPKSLEVELDATKEEVQIDLANKKSYREGAEKYRREVINYMPQCPFTQITDERLLIASHIKPYSICIKKDKKEQALDFQNGLALSPTYDKLFDQGYITFSNDGRLICGTQLSAYTWEKLRINPNAKNMMRIYPEKRAYYLDYHRKHVFLDNYEELM